MQKLESVVTLQNTVVYPFLDHINSHLHNALLASETAAEYNTSPTRSLPEMPKIPPGKNLEHQWRLKRTTTSSGPKKKGIILK